MLTDKDACPVKPAVAPRKAVTILFLVVFIDLLGFGIMIPLVPFYVERLGVGPELITAILALYSLVQFAVTPFWGHVSDRVGRRPVLLLCMAGHIGAYVMLAFADTLAMLILSRVLGGLTAGNLAASYAYITDITPPQERSRHLGKISAAFGLGFVMGPALGGLLAGTGDIAEANFMRPALAAAGLSAVALVGILLFLPESHRPVRSGLPGAPKVSGPGLREGIGLILRRRTIALMIMLCLIVITFAAVRESIFSLWANHQFGYNAATIGLFFSFNGVIITLIQFFGMGPLTTRFGEHALLMTGMLMYTLSWIGLIVAQGMVGLFLAMAASGVGTALFGTSLQSLLSRRAGPQERGAVMGVYQSTSSLGRFCGQTMSGTLYGQVGPNAPFAIGALAMIPAFVIAVMIGRRLRAERPSQQTPGEQAAAPLDANTHAAPMAGQRAGRH
ncbi:MAG: MFS transporter [Gammaproteobacteria bacterium]|nr:MAG: MFS transporter [Gammaproteobacteria bacterium]